MCDRQGPQSVLFTSSQGLLPPTSTPPSRSLVSSFVRWTEGNFTTSSFWKTLRKSGGQCKTLQDPEPRLPPALFSHRYLPRAPTSFLLLFFRTLLYGPPAFSGPSPKATPSSGPSLKSSPPLPVPPPRARPFSRSFPPPESPPPLPFSFPPPPEALSSGP